MSDEDFVEMMLELEGAKNVIKDVKRRLKHQERLERDVRVLKRQLAFAWSRRFDVSNLRPSVN